jgi:hypothetical protein
MIQLSTLLDLNTLILMQRASKHKTHPYAFTSTGGLSFSDLSLVSDFSLVRTTHSQQGMGLVVLGVCSCCRPKTSRTTIERRYRMNLNARIQGLRMAVPALRVLEEWGGGRGRVRKAKRAMRWGGRGPLPLPLLR